MRVNDLVLVQGMKDTRLALRRWNEHPLSVLGPWLALSLLTAAALLLAVWVVASLSPADSTPLAIPGLNVDPTASDYGHILYRNALVLALHGMACLAGFMAGSSLPLSAANRSGLDRWVHEKAGKLAIGFVMAATLFSLSTQAYGIGGNAATIAAQLDISPAQLIVSLLPHAIPELTALFLPLAAWLVASRRDRWDELLAATVVTVGLAVPVLLGAAAVELYVSPDLLRALAT
jgi:hypothetical protein